MAFKPSLKRTQPLADTRMNITPIMNLMVVLIPMLLAGAKFTELALLEYLPPAETGGAADLGVTPSEGSTDMSQEKELNLLVNILHTGVQVSIFQSTEPGPNFFEIPLGPDGNYDWKALNDTLRYIKESIVGAPIGKKRVFVESDSTWQEVDAYQYVDASEVSITALGDIRFQTIVRAMDSCQKYRTHKLVNGQTRIIEKELFPLTVFSQFQELTFIKR